MDAAIIIALFGLGATFWVLCAGAEARARYYINHHTGERHERKGQRP